VVKVTHNHAREDSHIPCESLGEAVYVVFNPVAGCEACAIIVDAL
jgi:hypothetical protein